ncbi:hypothetical protein BAE44_0017807 [Dichanthelium oligosanthes]|uniref:Uncharacterized protein n=1 Tax=Dichanthelium oligosanthes TaxID=888268 RepID=A0A1E5V821_9POAL|nr:hypothetical protein BAE44_0017807 [Dichanthelium oligosanthes]
MSSTAAGARLLGGDAPPPAPSVCPCPAQSFQALVAGLDSDGVDWGTFANPCVQFFLADGSTPPQRLRALLVAAWNYDPDTALKLVCNLRGVRGTGRGDREGFYTAALWMHQAHPHTLALNLPALVEFGYIKDFPELLYRLVKGPDVREVEKAKAKAWAKARKEEEAGAGLPLAGRKRARSDDCDGHDDPAPAAPSDDHNTKAASAPAPSKTEEMARLAARALRMYGDDSAYRFLFDSVADFFADRLKSDLEKKANGEEHEIGLAAKWCPSVDSSFNRATLLCEAIARRLFPGDSNAAGGDPQHQERYYVYRVLGHLRRKVLVPLRKVLMLPEVYMSAQEWSELPYQRVARKAMERYEAIFLKQDEMRFKGFIAGREQREAKHILRATGLFRAGGVVVDDILPHQILVSLMAQVKQGWLPWTRLVARVRGDGLFRNCMAVCDLSDGTRGTRRDVCVAPGLLISELAEEDWENLLWPFGAAAPCLIRDAVSIRERLDAVGQIDGGDSKVVDLRAVFGYILSKALWLQISPEKMVRTIFVVTDEQEFEQALPRPWRRDYKAICESFSNHGYAHVVPQVVYWNLGGRRSAALTSTRDGVMRLSGYSDSFFRMFIELGGIVGPEDEMRASIKGHHYGKLKVFY